jgi:hypothetical protein
MTSLYNGNWIMRDGGDPLPPPWPPMSPFGGNGD